MRTTLRDIAEKAKVSPSTVSRVLNNKGRVGEETAHRIRALAEELGYRSPGQADRVPAKASFAIGLFFNRRLRSLVSDPFYGEVMVGIEETLQGLGYHLILRSIGDEDLENGLIERFQADDRIDGLLLAGCDIPVEAVRRAQERRIPCVLVDNDMPGVGVDSVIARNRDGVWAAMRYLYQANHRRIGFIGGPQSHISLAERYRGYLEAAQAFGLEADSSLVYMEEDVERHGPQAGYAGVLALLGGRRPPTAILADNDMTAIGSLKALQEKGIDVPGEVSLVGFDDIDLARHTHPPLTTVRVPKREMGTYAARRIVELVEGRQGAPITILLHTQLVLRESTGPARGVAQGTTAAHG